ncbi:ABC transporter ATP-binding protein [Methanoplanus limicola]|uniref:ABC transporter ATP-binding protein n=1 Tax=Methanoplanus limicola TaxID=2315 RepID=UPI00064FAA9A|nr:ABC transporter ATP-binding protein [Methanoplanus limicola]
MKRKDNPLILVESLSYSYPRSLSERKKEAISGVSLEIMRGERVVLTGPSGSGKSTLIQTFIGLIPHSGHGKIKGRVFVDGLDTSGTTIQNLSGIVGFVFQDPDYQIVSNEVDSEIAFGPEQSGISPEEIEERIAGVSAVLNITHLRGREISELSWGERQKVAIASVLVMRPAIIVLDEPLSGLDTASAASLLKNLRTVSDEWDIAVVIVEHRLDLLAGFMDRVIVMDDGRVVYDGPVADFSGKSDVSDISLLSGTEGFKADSGEVSGSPDCSPVLEAVDLCYTYPRSKRPALISVNASFYPGEAVFVCGPNGSGKSTFIKHLNGLLIPDSGCVRLFGEDIAGRTVSENAHYIALLGQHADYQLFEETIEAELAFGPRNLGMDKRAIDNSVDETMKLMNISHLGRKGRPLKLSMGEKQRVAMAGHMIMDTPIVVLDEPTLGLDKVLKMHLASTINDLKGRGKTFIIITHDMEFARLCADRYLRFENGCLAGGDS